jgi:hypothetical protein
MEAAGSENWKVDVSALADTGREGAPLGEILLHHGVITQDELAIVLAEQQVTGEPLGSIVIARGFAASTTVAAALATQHGGLLKTEYGFATPFGPPPASPAGNAVPQLEPAPAEPAPPAPPVSAVTELRVDELTRERDELKIRVLDAAEQLQRLTEENAALSARLDGDRERWGDEIDRLSGDNKALELQVADLLRGRDGAAASSAESDRLAAENARLAEQVAKLTAALEAPRADGGDVDARITELELAVARVTNRSSTISERLDEVIGELARLHGRLS